MRKEMDLVYVINHIVGPNIFTVYMQIDNTIRFIFHGDVTDWILNFISHQVEHSLVKKISYKRNIFYLYIDWVNIINYDDAYEDFLSSIESESQF